MTARSNERFQETAHTAVVDEPNCTQQTTRAVVGSPSNVASQVQRIDPARHSHVLLDRTWLRNLRHTRLMSQQELADDCWQRNIQLSLTTIKRAELGRPVRFRIAREFARYFGIALTDLIQVGPTTA